MKVISFDSRQCRNLEFALGREWIETNQFGGYASSTILGVNTRRYHGFFVPQFKPPLGRYVLLSNLEEILYVDDVAYPLSSQLFSETVYPEGYLNLNEFSLLPFPSWTYYIEDIVLVKSLILMHDEQTLIVRYQILEGDKNFVRLELKPLTAFRSIHSLIRQNSCMNTKIELDGNRVRFAGLYFHHNAAILDQSGKWVKNLYYPEEKKRGLDFEEDLYQPFRLVYTFVNGNVLFFAATLQDIEHLNFQGRITEEENRRYRILKKINVSDSRFQLLAYSGNKFFVNLNVSAGSSDLLKHLDGAVRTVRPQNERSSSESDQIKNVIVAGYPWFENQAWDALVSFHGLTLSTGQYQIARNILSFYAAQVKEGFLLNQLFDANLPLHSVRNGSGEFSSADTAFWLIHAVFEYFHHTGDLEKISELFPILNSVIESFIKGTFFGVKVDSDGLICLPDESKALTWMSAVTHAGVPITPRTGKPVELQALWFNALGIMAYLSEQLGKLSLKKFYEQLAVLAKRSFNRFFWNDSTGCLYDVVHDKKDDPSLRPNQLFSMSLPFPILEDNMDKWRSILTHATKELLTPYGLRSLAPSDVAYRGRVEGDSLNRPEADHQGAVWPWLSVPYLTASLKISPNGVNDKSKFMEFLNPLLNHTEARGLGFVSEIFDGDPPHQPRQAPAFSVNLAACLHLYELLSADQKNSGSKNQFALGKKA